MVYRGLKEIEVSKVLGLNKSLFLECVYNILKNIWNHYIYHDISDYGKISKEYKWEYVIKIKSCRLFPSPEKCHRFD